MGASGSHHLLFLFPKFVIFAGNIPSNNTMFNSYRSFIPKVSSLFVLTLLFWGGWILAFLVLILIGLMWKSITDYPSLELIIMYTFAFGLPMHYAHVRAKKNEKEPDCVRIPVDAPDYGKYGAPVWWIGSITAGIMLVLLALWLTSYIPANDTMGSYSVLVDSLQLSTLDIIISELVYAPLFTTWFVCVACVRGLTGNGFAFPLSLVAAVIGLFLIDLDYASLLFTVAQVVCVGFVYRKTCSVRLSYVTMLVMCGLECLNLINHFIY